MDNNGTELIDALDALLERERNALLNGDLTEIPEIVAEKERLIDALAEAGTAQAEQLAPVQMRATQNQLLLQSAMEGIRSVADRMAELRKVRGGLQTYDRSGQRQQFAASHTPRLEKRA